MGIYPSAIHRWRIGQGTPSVDDIGMAHKHYALDPTWLITGKGAMFGVRDISKELKDIQKEVINLQKLLQK